MDITLQNNEPEKVDQETTFEEQEVIEQIALEPDAPENIIEAWRQEHGKLYLSVYDEQEFIWRKVKRAEYVEIMENTTEEDESVDDIVEQRQRLTLYRCLLSPSDQDIIDMLIEDYPGILTSLSAEILKRSGFSKPLTIEI